MSITLIHNINIVNEGNVFHGSILLNHDRIEKIYQDSYPFPADFDIDHSIDGQNNYLIPGVIDDQVHFREPGLTHKADIESESKAAVAGGITSYMEMPNTIPQTISIDLLEEKFHIADKKSYANYSFYFGATNDNRAEIKKINPKKTCGVKIFMGSSTGNMLVDNLNSLEAIFSESPVIIATHCEDESTINQNLYKYQQQFNQHIPIHYHPKIRSEEACFKSSSLAVSLAEKYRAKLHILHLSTAKEMELFSPGPPESKNITGEVCIHHLWFNENDYPKYGPAIKWNPAVKSHSDQEGLLNALLQDKLDVIATDHAPHLPGEKQMPFNPDTFNYTRAASGGPLVQHALVAILELYHQKKIGLEKIVDKMCHAPARLFDVKDRGFIREGYYADLVLVNLNDPWTVSENNVLYKCGWSPFINETFHSSIAQTFVNGQLIYDYGKFHPENKNARRLEFDR